ncbi:UNVERIFIED_CONTAM: hypothetical protein FKN15_056317, partial [Acipenser sinensis]
HWKLLGSLKTTVEGLLSTNNPNVWSKYGGLERLCKDMNNILSHGLLHDEVYCKQKDYWCFVWCVRYVSPQLAPHVDQLRPLLHQRSYTHKFYTDCAFLLSDPHVTAMFQCLEAVEQNNPKLLALIDTTMLARKKESPVLLMKSQSLLALPGSVGILPHNGVQRKYTTSYNSQRAGQWSPLPSAGNTDTHSAAPCLAQFCSAANLCFCVSESLPEVPNVMEYSAFSTHSSEVSTPSSLYMESEGSQVSSVSDSMFRRPSEGQSLISYLSEQDFGSCADLEKENAHFSISESLIAAIELMKCNLLKRGGLVSEGEGEEENDREILELKQKIRLRRQQIRTSRLQPPAPHSHSAFTTTDSGGSQHSSQESLLRSDSSSIDEVEEYELRDGNDGSNLILMSKSGLSLSMASLFSGTGKSPRAITLWLRKVVVAKQNYRCAGCGIRTDPDYIKRLRYCEYLGKYFCQCCHENSQSVVPSRILRKWDFSKYYLSNFSRDLLAKIWGDPLFDVQDINSALYRKVKALEQVRVSEPWLLEQFDREPGHLTEDLHLYSLSDLSAVRKGELPPRLRELVRLGAAHVHSCVLCQAKGFICEFCGNGKDILFPFELNKCRRCEECKACYHKNCFRSEDCPRCSRLAARREQLARQNMEQYEEEGESEGNEGSEERGGGSDRDRGGSEERD